MKITIEKRGDDYVAYLNDNPAQWEAGKTMIEALGKLVWSYQHEMGVYIDRSKTL